MKRPQSSGPSLFPGWKKFKRPPHPALSEHQMPHMVPTSNQLLTYVEEIDRLNPHEYIKEEPGFIEIRKDVIKDQLEGEAQRRMMNEFRDFLRGRQFGNKDAGWEGYDLYSAKGVIPFLDQASIKRKQLTLLLADLKLRAPRNTHEAWLWFKYVKKGTPLNTKFDEEHDDFLPPPEDVTFETYNDKNVPPPSSSSERGLFEKEEVRMQGVMQLSKRQKELTRSLIEKSKQEEETEDIYKSQPLSPHLSDTESLPGLPLSPHLSDTEEEEKGKKTEEAPSSLGLPQEDDVDVATAYKNREEEIKNAGAAIIEKGEKEKESTPGFFGKIFSAIGKYASSTVLSGDIKDTIASLRYDLRKREDFDWDIEKDDKEFTEQDKEYWGITKEKLNHIRRKMDEYQILYDFDTWANMELYLRDFKRSAKAGMPKPLGEKLEELDILAKRKSLRRYKQITKIEGEKKEVERREKEKA